LSRFRRVVADTENPSDGFNRMISFAIVVLPEPLGAEMTTNFPRRIALSVKEGS
jgi:hypothetical protein